MPTPLISLRDLDDDDTPIKMDVEVSKPQKAPATRSAKPLKRKKADYDEVTDFDNSAASCIQSIENMCQIFKNKLTILEETKRNAQNCSLKLGSENSTLKSRLAESEKARLLEVDALKVELEGIKAKHQKEKDAMVQQMNVEAMIAVNQARIEMSEQADKAGYDISIWNVDKWKMKVVKCTMMLKGDVAAPTSSQAPLMIEDAKRPEEDKAQGKKIAGDDGDEGEKKDSLGDEGCDEKTGAQ